MWVLRPPLPQIHSFTGPLSDTALEEIAVLIGWVALVLAMLCSLYKLLQALAERPSRRRLVEHDRLERALARPERGGEPLTRGYVRYSPPLKLTVRPPTDTGDNGTSPEHPAPPVSIGDGASGQPMTRISLLGPFRIEGVEHASLRSACEQLIAYLALHSRGATRDQLIEAIWPEQDPQRARQRFWQNVSDARSLLAGALISNRGHYTLDRHQVAVDNDELEALLARANTTGEPKAQRRALERALRLFRGEPLAGWDHVWADADIRRLRSTHAELLERAGHARLVTGDPHGALQAAQQGLGLDAYNEGLWRLAMQAEGRLGLRDSVGRRYQHLRSLLDEQLGLEPERATRALYHELLGQR
jgi:DNA-binding SARP family transcriptional activator